MGFGEMASIHYDSLPSDKDRGAEPKDSQRAKVPLRTMDLSLRFFSGTPWHLVP
jgi:hypothetical protein